MASLGRSGRGRGRGLLKRIRYGLEPHNACRDVISVISLDLEPCLRGGGDQVVARLVDALAVGEKGIDDLDGLAAGVGVG